MPSPRREPPLSVRWDTTVARPLLKAVTHLTGETTAELLQRLVLEEYRRLLQSETSEEVAVDDRSA